MDGIHKIWASHLNNSSNAIFLLRVILCTIDACLKKEYTAFDAHTTSNCCHGMSLLACNLISLTLKLNLHELRRLCEQKIQDIVKNFNPNNIKVYEWIPEQLLGLSNLLILAFTREINEQKKLQTNVKKLKNISPIGTKFCRSIVSELKNIFLTLSHIVTVYMPKNCIQWQIPMAFPLAFGAPMLKKIIFDLISEVSIMQPAFIQTKFHLPILFFLKQR